MSVIKTKNLSYSDLDCSGRLVASVTASAGSVFIEPRVYGSIKMPLADTAFPERMEYSENKLCRFENKIIFSNHVLLNEDLTLMPQTFMRNRKYHHGGVKLEMDGTYSIKGKFQEDISFENIDSPVYHADTDHPDVYGHVLLEVLPSLWAKDLTCKRDLKIASSIKMNSSYKAIFDALNINEDRVIGLNSPIKAKELYYPSKVVQRRKYIDPLAYNVYDSLKYTLSKKTDVIVPERVYISRSKVSGRELMNEKALEDLFVSKGFTIIHPQELSIFQQVKIFSGAKYIAGVGGSAMHNTIFSSIDAKVLIVCSTGWLVVADSLICQNKDQLGYVFGTPDELHPNSHRTQSSWRVDLNDVKSAITQHFDL